MAHPLGRKLESHTKTLMEGGFPRNQLRPPNIGGGSVGVDVSLLLSLRQSARLCRLLPTGRKKVRELLRQEWLDVLKKEF